MTQTLEITHFTDPTCPYAFSAEPRMRRLEWQLGEQATWTLRMIGLVSDPAEAAARGFTTAMLTSIYADFAARYGMPFGQAPVPRLFASTPACLAVVATRRFAPHAEHALLRALRVHHFAGALVDDPATLPLVAADAGIDVNDLTAAMDDPASRAELADDMAAARTPTPAALAQPARLAGPGDERRYTCPSLEFRLTGGGSASAPGFQPDESYDVALANLDSTLTRRAPAATALEVLEWAPFPLATVEVAAIRAISNDEALAELHDVGSATHVGNDAYWRVPE